MRDEPSGVYPDTNGARRADEYADDARRSEGVRYVILDPTRGGYAYYDEVSGWHIVTMRAGAALFRTRTSAERVLAREFAGHSSAFVLEVAVLTETDPSEYKS